MLAGENTGNFPGVFSHQRNFFFYICDRFYMSGGISEACKPPAPLLGFGRMMMQNANYKPSQNWANHLNSETRHEESENVFSV